MGGVPENASLTSDGAPRKSINHQPTQLADGSQRMNNTTHPPMDLDLLSRIHNMYRLLELHMEEGSGGLVEKIVISQDSVRHLLDTECPRAYTSVSKIDFVSLDKLQIKPHGVYGSKDEIVRFLESLKAIDSTTAQLLRKSSTEISISSANTPNMRSGLYLLRPNSENSEVSYVIYWPEDATWEMKSPSSVSRNRETFIRYLTRLCDQVLALISKEDEQKLSWQESNDDQGNQHRTTTIGGTEYDQDEENDDSDRFFSFQVSQTNEQSEGITVWPGFETPLSSKSVQWRNAEVHPGIDTSLLEPKLIEGGQRQGFILTEICKETILRDPFEADWSAILLKDNIRKDNTALSLEAPLAHNPEMLRILVDNGLRDRFPKECSAWQARLQDISARLAAKRQEAQSNGLRSDVEISQIRGKVRWWMFKEVQKIYPSIDPEGILSPEEISSEDTVEESTVFTPDVCHQLGGALHSSFGRLGSSQSEKESAENRFHRIKWRCLLVHALFSDWSFPPETKPNIAQLILSKTKNNKFKEGIKSYLGPEEGRSILSSLTSIIPVFGTALSPSASSAAAYMKNLSAQAHVDAAALPDSEFIQKLQAFVSQDAAFAEVLAVIYSITHAIVRDRFEGTTDPLSTRVVEIIRKKKTDDQMQTLRAEADQEEKEACLVFASQIHIPLVPETNSGIILRHVNRGPEKGWGTSIYRQSPSFQVKGHRVKKEAAKFLYRLYTLSLTQADAHEVKLNPQFIPRPQIAHVEPVTFELPLTSRLRLVQLIGSRHGLLICDDEGVTKIYFNELSRLTTSRPKVFHHNRLGRNLLFSFDETQRLLALFYIQEDKPYLQIMVLNENNTSIINRGKSMCLAEWYPDAPCMRHISFVIGKQEIVLVEEEGTCRIFIFATELFRPAFLTLATMPTAFFSAPDGTCLLLVENSPNRPVLRAFHYASFGANPEGITTPLPGPFPTKNIVVTTFGQAGTFHMLSLCPHENLCRSIAVHVTQKTSEFLFQPGTNAAPQATSKPLQNPWISCHVDVWTRFPVIPAIPRENLSTLHRQPRRISFICEGRHSDFEPTLREMIRSFEKSTRKPTKGSLAAIHVEAYSFHALMNSERGTSNLSCFRFGEWIVELFCLIPIQIAITASNRFIPMKDGVLNPEFERNLLGADVNRLVDEMTIGWYESIFSSYLAKKSVKVVSSMGEQSVGKSYALNHFLDTSFAGSAMRCTEGVWLSVTPTIDTLIVALDFEGVHSIERSAQEDMLLVLFNAALSNLVLFRNNFSLGRDITGLFTSFQSSSAVLDPAQNPSLFQSSLAIIIKDVVDSDAQEIVKEFSLKFQRIVQNEQGNNFLTRLHQGKLNIIPWPVITSPQFYRLFNNLRIHLSKQRATHPTAGAFLHSLKVLMAKLKANDWGAMENNLAAHRAQQLSEGLALAIRTGLAETDPYPEPLKCMDTGEDILHEEPFEFKVFLPSADTTPAVQSQARELALSQLRLKWQEGKELRWTISNEDWTTKLSQYLDGLAQVRLQHVKSWLDQNTAQFPESNPDIRALMRTFEEAKAETLAGVQICGATCDECRLSCIVSKHHLGGHDCKTNHKCPHLCDFSVEHPEDQACGFPAGHSGRHLCQTSSHFCGEPCMMQGKLGCLGSCVKDVDHDGTEHICSARTHACGAPCQLSAILGAQREAICSGQCIVDCQTPHSEHLCDKTSCPVSCQLCRRLCAVADHSHPLKHGVIHLCGQEHSCQHPCESPGICDIAVTPHSIESTFRGKHETFQYTKYTQEARRLTCAIPIAPDQIFHEGAHRHSADPKVFHFCETRCKNCSYYCTLPLGHQQEHETSHGSMSETQWAIEGAENSFLEVQGRKFATGDAGGPMLCNLVCSDLGRHVHVDYCRGNCDGEGMQHVRTPGNSSNERGKDWISHHLYWARTGFKDPYSRDEQSEFAKCDSMCSDPAHAVTTGTAAANPSFCELPIFHPPQRDPVGTGYISSEGHHFLCRNPALSINAFHVVFVLDRSGSMRSQDRSPLANAPASPRIARYNNNRFGAVLSALYGFWRSRQQAISSGGPQNLRRDAYSVILFNSTPQLSISNDFISTPDQLLDAIVSEQSGGGTNFDAALRMAQQAVERNWSTERHPVVIFLSDGESRVSDSVVYDICRLSARLGRSLGFYAVSFGVEARSQYLRRMVEIAREVHGSVPRDMASGAESSYSNAVDTIRLAETFVNIADSLRKARGGLMRI